MISPYAKRSVFGIPIDPLTMEQALAVLDSAIQRRQPLQIGVVNAAKVVNMRSDEQLRQAVLSSDLLLADGMSVVWAARLLRRPLPQRVAGIDLMFRLLELADRSGYRVYCLGATEDVLEKVIARIQREYPRLQLAGWHHGYFNQNDEQTIVADIASSRPDILLVAMTSPKKEQFLARWSHQISVPVCHGVGGSFDVMAGKVQRAPRSWQRIGMEWAYRLIQEPGRMWRRYLVTNALFLYMLWNEWIGSSQPRKRL